MSAAGKNNHRKPAVVAICGGVGGAKLALGLNRLLGADLTIIVNTGDDFEHLGLHISPDIDTVMYTLAGLSDQERGWGRADETWNFMASLEQIGGAPWFRLGDRDLAMHIERTRALRGGASLTDFTTSVARTLGIASAILPMSDDRVETVVDTDVGQLPFQEYFVRLQCKPRIRQLSFRNAERAVANPSALKALSDPALTAVIICPSNPFLSIDPILAVPGIRSALDQVSAPIIAVSPLIAGQAVKGPTAKIMSELGVPADSVSIAQHYEFLNGLVIDNADQNDASRIAVRTHVTPTLMKSIEDRDRLAAACMDFVSALASEA